jgi:membrane protein DedA with SNARE-associated domain
MGYGQMWAVIPLAIVGVLGGDSVLYWMSRHYGQRVMRLPMFSRVITEHRIARARHLFHRYGGRVLLVARFTAGIRASSHVVAGLLELPYRTFLFYDAIAAVVSVPIMVWLGWYFADDINRLFRWEHQTTWAILGVIALLVAVLFILHWRTRRREEINAKDANDAKGEEEENRRS